MIEINTFPHNVCDGDFGTIVEGNDVPHINVNEVTYANFFEEYLHKNKPCVLKSVTNNWGSSRYWIIDNKPNFEYFLKKYSK